MFLLGNIGARTGHVFFSFDPHHVLEQFGGAVGAHAPTYIDHCYDSARQPWLHTHLLYGALVATDDGFKPLAEALVAEQASLHIWGYHLLLRRAVNELLRDLDLGWALPAEDGSCEVLGLPTRVLTAVEQPCRPFAEIQACVLE